MNVDFVTEYHDLLVSGDPLAEWEQFKAGMEAHNLRFKERYVCNVLRPFLLPRARYDEVVRATDAFFGAIRTLYGWLMEDAALRARVGLTEVEEAALHVDPGFPSPDGIGRLDGFLDPQGTLRFVEYNADSPGGLAFGPALGDLFMALPTMRRFAERHAVQPPHSIADIQATLLNHYRVWGGTEERPSIGIVDWQGLGTAPEFVLCQEHFERAGYPTIITHPAALALRGGTLWDEESGWPLHIVYKRVLVGELLEQLGLENVLTDAIRQHAACVVNSYRAQLLFKKALFALLSEMADDARFPARQREAIHRHLPWTRLLVEGRVTYEGRDVEMLSLLLDGQERFALKPNSEYGGKGVVLGWEIPATEWQQALNDALQSGQPHVVQERIMVASEPFPLVRDGSLVIEPRFMDLDPYTFGVETVRGAGVRLGASGLLNVTAGSGSAVPLVLVG
ncbi:MAG TPA: hypothetical protein VF707_01925 [Ardenticatenaceae bacterium]|jgi:hypothetical protein